MERRPYFDFSTSQLSELVESNTQTRPLLEAIYFELKFRNTAAAKQLKLQVEQILDSSSNDSEDLFSGVDTQDLTTQKSEPIGTKSSTSHKTNRSAQKEQDQQITDDFLNSVDPFVLESLEILSNLVYDPSGGAPV